MMQKKAHSNPKIQTELTEPTKDKYNTIIQNTKKSFIK
jgi:hypothetical protein